MKDKRGFAAPSYLRFFRYENPRVSGSIPSLGTPIKKATF